MEEHKYYTPEIEEFHVGFEYETIKKWSIKREGGEITFDHSKDEWSEASYSIPWRGYVLPEGFIPATLEETIAAGVVRVKCLDREDIESLGFADAERPDNFGCYAGEYMIIKDAKMRKPSRTEVVDIHLVFQPLTSWILIWQIMDLNIGKQENTRFCGTIKNKSELKRILKQIGI